MNDLLGVTAEELVQSLKRRNAALPSEIGTFVALEACEVLCERGGAVVNPNDVRISLDGSVSVFAPTGSADEEQGARSVHKLLTSLLLASGPSLPPGLMRLVDRPVETESWNLAQMRDDLEAALVPLNRKAARRVLSRLLREMERGGGPSSRAPAPSLEDLDNELGALLGGSPAAERAPDARRDDETQRDLITEVIPEDEAEEEQTVPGEDSDARTQFFHSSAPPPPVEPQVPLEARPGTRLSDPNLVTQDVPAPASAPAHAPISQQVTTARPESDPVLAAADDAPTQLRGLEELSESMRPEAKRRGVWIGLGLTLLAVALVGVIFVVRPDALARLTGSAPPAPEAPPIDLPPAPQGGDLTVRVSPERSQVLRFVGRGPVTVENLPTGVAHELVAVADGRAPSRVVIPADAEWEKVGDGLRYEVAVQTGAPTEAAKSLDLGETLLPPDLGTASSQLGDVRVVTTPRGAKVYQLIGFAPEVRAQNLPVDEVMELLVYAKGMEPQVKVISPSDWASDGGRKTAELDITLARAR